MAPQSTYGDRRELQATGNAKQRNPATDVGAIEPVGTEKSVRQLRPKVIWEGAEETTGVNAPERVLRMKLEGDLVTTNLALEILHDDGLLGGRHNRRRRAILPLRGFGEVVEGAEQNRFPGNPGSCTFTSRRLAAGFD